MKSFLLVICLFFAISSSGQKKNQEPRTEKMSEHSLSFNPFFVPLLSANLRYNYFFTEKMHWAINGRFTYMSQLLDFSSEDSYLMFGAGIKYVPLYYKILALGVDITPTYIQEVFPVQQSKTGWLFPISINVDLLLTERVGGVIDFGVGYLTGDVLEQEIVPRGHIGIVFMFGQSRLVYPQNHPKL